MTDDADASDESVDPMAQLDVEREISRLSKRLERVTVDHAGAAQRAAMSEWRFKVERAKSHLRIKATAEGRPTVADLEAEVTVEMADLLQTHLIDEAHLRAYQEEARNLRAQLDALRSLNANARTLLHHG